MTIKSGTANGSKVNLLMLFASFLVETKLDVLCQLVGCAQRGECAGIRPPALQDIVCHGTSADICVVDVRDLQFTTMRRDQGRNDVKDLSIIHIDASNSQVALGVGRLLLDTQDMSVLGPVSYTKTPGVLHLFEEDPRTPPLALESFHGWCEVILEDVVPQNDTGAVTRAETTSQSQSLGDAACLVLHLVR